MYTKFYIYININKKLFCLLRGWEGWVNEDYIHTERIIKIYTTNSLATLFSSGDIKFTLLVKL